MKNLGLILVSMFLLGCTTNSDVGKEAAKEKLEFNTGTYIPYRYVIPEPPNDPLPPPKFIRSTGDNKTYYQQQERVAYADALVEYYDYMERYITALRDVSGNPIAEVGGQRCRNAISNMVVSVDLPNKPPAPSYSHVEKQDGAELMVKYLGEVDRWIESLESSHDSLIHEYRAQISMLKKVCM